MENAQQGVSSHQSVCCFLKWAMRDEQTWIKTLFPQRQMVEQIITLFKTQFCSSVTLDKLCNLFKSQLP